MWPGPHHLVISGDRRPDRPRHHHFAITGQAITTAVPLASGRATLNSDIQSLLSNKGRIIAEIASPR
jgi:hypothetical protein